MREMEPELPWVQKLGPELGQVRVQELPRERELGLVPGLGVQALDWWALEEYIRGLWRSWVPWLVGEHELDRGRDHVRDPVDGLVGAGNSVAGPQHSVRSWPPLAFDLVAPRSSSSCRS